MAPEEKGPYPIFQGGTPMHHTIRNLLGLAAATAVIAVGVPALTSSASAASSLRPLRPPRSPRVRPPPATMTNTGATTTPSISTTPGRRQGPRLERRLRQNPRPGQALRQVLSELALRLRPGQVRGRGRRREHPLGQKVRLRRLPVVPLLGPRRRQRPGQGLLLGQPQRQEEVLRQVVLHLRGRRRRVVSVDQPEDE